ncbi:MAG: type II and III secretion system protein family protein [Inquilinaceae bacterium]
MTAFPSLIRPLIRLCSVLLVAAAMLTAAAPSQAVDFLGQDATPLTLSVSKGQLIRLDRPAASVFIADPAIADIEVMSPRMIYVFARAPGETNLFAIGEDDSLINNVRLTVFPDIDRLDQSIARLAPGSAVQVTPIDRSLMLTGRVGTGVEAADIGRLAGDYLADPAQVINRVHVDGATQVNLRVRIAEVSREVVREIGINWESLLSVGDFTFGLATGRDAFQVVDGLPTVIRDGITDSILGQFRNDNLDINVLIDALERENLVNILAEPNLTATSGDTASFLAGGEFPIPVSQDDNEVSIEFKPFGVSLAFTPTVLGNGRINMRVRPEVSQLTSTGAITLDSLTIPALITRRAETTVELGSGQSFAIAGLFQANETEDSSGLPLLKDIPVLGLLFRSERFQRNETELVIVVTPYLVEPVSGPIALPTDRDGPQPSRTTDLADGTAAVAAAESFGTVGGFILK